MTDTIGPMPARIDQQQLAQQLVDSARADGVELVGPDGMLTGLTKTVLETALEAELDEHLGYQAHAVEGRDGGNSRNGTRPKTVLTEIGPVQIEVPRDRDGSFDPQLVRKRQRRLSGIDEIVLSLCARGLTTGEIAAHSIEPGLIGLPSAMEDRASVLFMLSGSREARDIAADKLTARTAGP